MMVCNSPANSFLHFFIFHFSPKDLHFEEIGLVETLVDVAKLSEELDSFVPDILVLLVDKEQLGMESEKSTHMYQSCKKDFQHNH